MTLTTAITGIVDKPSNHSFDETVDRLKNILQSTGVTLFALVDHSSEAEKAGMKMPPTKLLIFGNPKAGLGAARLRKMKELVDAKMEDDLGLDEMAESVGLSTAHFARMFRQSTGETPHQFVLRQRIERAKAMLRAPDARVLDVALACGFKTQQHFAQVFRDVCRVSPTEYRQDFLGSRATCAFEICLEDTVAMF